MAQAGRMHAVDQRVPTKSAWAHRIRGSAFVPCRPSAVHTYAALAFFTSGRAFVDQDGHFEARAGDVYLIPAGAPHRVAIASAADAWGVGFWPSSFASPDLAPMLEPLERASRRASKIISIPTARHEHLASLCRELHATSSPDRSSRTVELVRRSLLTLILSEIAESVPASEHGRQPGLVGEALRYIERHCLDPISLRDVARAVHRSPSHVSTTVRRTTGTSVMDWIISGRLAEARSRLQHTDENVETIAERVGYANPTHFIRLFRRAHGCTPAAWRRRQRG